MNLIARRAACAKSERKQHAGPAKCDGCQGEFSELRDFPTSGCSAVAPSGGEPRLGLNLGGLGRFAVARLRLELFGNAITLPQPRPCATISPAATPALQMRRGLGSEVTS